jgi:hypothetical protein
MKETLHRPNVSVVLEYRILERIPVFEQDLSPVRLLRIGEDPAFAVLGLDDEYAELGDEDVIDLGCTVPQLKGDVIHQVKFRRTEVPEHHAGEKSLATVLVRVGAASIGDTVAADGEPNDKRSKYVEKSPIVVRPVKDKPQSALSFRVI